MTSQPAIGVRRRLKLKRERNDIMPPLISPCHLPPTCRRRTYSVAVAVAVAATVAPAAAAAAAAAMTMPMTMTLTLPVAAL